jgi:SH3 domain
MPKEKKEKKSRKGRRDKKEEAAAPVDLPEVSDDAAADATADVAAHESEIEAREKALAEKEAQLRARLEAKKAKKKAAEAPDGKEDGAEDGEDGGEADQTEDAPAGENETEVDAGEDVAAEDGGDDVEDQADGEETAEAAEEGADQGAAEEGGDDEGAEDGEEYAEGETPAGEMVLEYPNEYYDDEGNFVGNPDVVGWAHALYDYTTNGEGEISLTKGELVGILEHDNGGWTRGDFYGYIGSFPTSYVELYDEQQAAELAERQKAATERAQARRAQRDQLKGEMREVRAKLEVAEQEAEKLEAAIQSLSAQRQKLHKDFRKQQANSSDEDSVLLDLLKLAYDMDVESDAYLASTAARQQTLETLAACSADLSKEAKHNPGLGVYSQNLISKLGSARKASTTARTAHEDAQAKAAQFRHDVSVLVAALSASK